MREESYAKFLSVGKISSSPKAKATLALHRERWKERFCEMITMERFPTYSLLTGFMPPRGRVVRKERILIKHTSDQNAQKLHDAPR